MCHELLNDHATFQVVRCLLYIFRFTQIAPVIVIRAKTQEDWYATLEWLYGGNGLGDNNFGA